MPKPITYSDALQALKAAQKARTKLDKDCEQAEKETDKKIAAAKAAKEAAEKTALAEFKKAVKAAEDEVYQKFAGRGKAIDKGIAPLKEGVVRLLQIAFPGKYGQWKIERDHQLSKTSVFFEISADKHNDERAMADAVNAAGIGTHGCYSDRNVIGFSVDLSNPSFSLEKLFKAAAEKRFAERFEGQTAPAPGTQQHRLAMQEIKGELEAVFEGKDPQRKGAAR